MTFGGLQGPPTGLRTLWECPTSPVAPAVQGSGAWRGRWRGALECDVQQNRIPSRDSLRVGQVWCRRLLPPLGLGNRHASPTSRMVSRPSFPAESNGGTPEVVSGLVRPLTPPRGRRTEVSPPTQHNQSPPCLLPRSPWSITLCCPPLGSISALPRGVLNFR